MRHFPLYRDLRGRRLIVSGGGGAAVAKLPLLLKTEARIDVFAPDPAPEIRR
jgi:uroporphyrin-III C-methyltransferase/precorrin-2 dehydrogenase/sirohydrochlorin ferrochelatase